MSSLRDTVRWQILHDLKCDRTHHQLLTTLHQQLKTLLHFCLQSSYNKAFYRQMVDATERLPVSVLVEHVLPLLDRASRNRLCSTSKEVYAASRNVTNPAPWPFKRRLHLGGRGNVYSVAFSPDSQLMASGGSDYVIRIWDRTDGRCTLLAGHTNYVHDLCFSPDEKLLASASSDMTIRLWKLQDRSVRVLQGHRFRVSSVVFSHDGSTLASRDIGEKIRLWDVNDGRCIRELVDERIGSIFSITFAPDGKTIAASAGFRYSADRDERSAAIVFWDLSGADDLSPPTVVETYDGPVFSLEYSPDGRYFATGAEDGTVRLWNVADNRWTRVMTSKIDPVVLSVAFSPNGKILASASLDGSVRLWSVEDGDSSCLVELLGHHEGAVYSVAFSPDGQTLASSGRDGTVRLWNPHEEDRKQFKRVDWETVFLLWNPRGGNHDDDDDDDDKGFLS